MAITKQLNCTASIPYMIVIHIIQHNNSTIRVIPAINTKMEIDGVTSTDRQDPVEAVPSEIIAHNESICAQQLNEKFNVLLVQIEERDKVIEDLKETVRAIREKLDSLEIGNDELLLKSLLFETRNPSDDLENMAKLVHSFVNNVLKVTVEEIDVLSYGWLNFRSGNRVE